MRSETKPKTGAIGKFFKALKEKYFFPVEFSYLTSKIYYSSQKGEIYSINNEAVTEDYIKENSEKADKIIKISNDIINFNLINELEEKSSNKK